MQANLVYVDSKSSFLTSLCLLNYKRAKNRFLLTECVKLIIAQTIVTQSTAVIKLNHEIAMDKDQQCTYLLVM